MFNIIQTIKELEPNQIQDIFWIILIGFAGLQIYTWFTLPECSPNVCWYEHSINGRMYGRCEDIYLLKKLGLENNTLYDEGEIIPIFDWENFREKIVTTTTTTQTTTLYNCPTTTTIKLRCPPCTIPPAIYEPSEIQTKCIKQLKKPGTAIVCQRCYYMGVDDAGECIGIKQPKYKRGPSMDIAPMLYRKDPVNDTITLRVYWDKIGPHLRFNRTAHNENRSMRSKWAWNDDSCKSSSIRLNLL